MRRFGIPIAALALMCALAGPAHANIRPLHYLPFERGVERDVTCGNNDCNHSESTAYAWDFAGNNWQVRAARTGVVTARRDNKNPGNPTCDPSLAGQANYVRLLHSDSTETLYTHLQKGSVSALGVSAGDVLNRYRPLGRTDSTGYSCGAHLHYQVQEHCSTSSGFCDSLSSSFMDDDVIAQHSDGIPESGDEAESSNHPDDRFGLDEDGNSDLDTLNDGSGTDVMGMLSNGVNGFGTPTQWRDLSWNWDGIKALMGDVDGDGSSDLVTLNSGSGTDVMVMLSNGVNGFGTPTQWRDLSWNWQGIKPLIGDVDGDGLADLVTLNDADTAGTDVMVMLSNGEDGFGTPSQWYDLSWGWDGIKPVMGDVDADWMSDLVTLNYPGGPGTDVMVMLSNGSDAFGTPEQWLDLSWGWGGIKPLMGDVSGDTPDGKADLITLNNAGGAGTDVMGMLSNGEDAFGTPTQWRDLSWGWSGIKPFIGDMNGDGDADLGTLNNAGGAGTDVMGMLSNGTNGFGTPTQWRDLSWGWSGILLPVYLPPPECSNGLDDDQDTYFDLNDADCDDVTDDDESG